MESDKLPGPDGFNPGVYKRFWDKFGDQIVPAYMSWLSNGHIPPTLNDTNIVLIPNSDNPESMRDWRLVALCNVLYKLVSKVLANRLKPFFS